MSLEENRDFLSQQRDLFRNLHRRSESLVDKQEKEVMSIRDRISRLQARVRALQDTLSSASSTPSVAAIQRRVNSKGIGHSHQDGFSFLEGSVGLGRST